MGNGAATAALILVALAAGPGCTKSDRSARAESAREPRPDAAPPARRPSTAEATTVTVTAAEVPGPRGSAAPGRAPARTGGTGAIESVDVPDDASVLVVDGDDPTRAIIHLHGMCSEPRPDLEAWSSGVRERGVIIALTGDTKCGDGGWTWTTQAAAIDSRIEAAIGAVRAARHVELAPERMVLIGESMGASRAEALAAIAPDKYQRLVLVGAPSTPSSTKLKRTKAVALLAGDREPQENMRSGEKGLRAAGLTARFWELPEASHGEYGPDGARLMSDAVAFVTQE